MNEWWAPHRILPALAQRARTEKLEAPRAYDLPPRTDTPPKRLAAQIQPQKCRVLTVGSAPAIVDVHDGDTFRAVLVLEGQTGVGFWPWLRLDGCDAYELHEPGGVEAQEWAVEFLQAGSDIDVYLMGWSFDRRVARVIVDGVDMSHAIIEAGHAVPWKRPS